MKTDTIQATKMQKVENSRDYLTAREVSQIMDAAKNYGRYGSRDALMVMVAYRHGLRVSELIELKWSDVNFDTATMHVARKKDSNDSVHPIDGDELRVLRQLKRDSSTAFVFCSERGGPMTRDNVNKMLKKAGEIAGLSFRIHPHMLRHACGYALANDQRDARHIQDYLGHKNIQNTVRYTRLNAEKFKGFGRAFR